MVEFMKSKISNLIADISSTALQRVDNGDMFQHYVSVVIFPCHGGWQVWLNFDEHGNHATHEILINDEFCFEGKELQSTLLKVLKQLKNKNSRISIRARGND